MALDLTHETFLESLNTYKGQTDRHLKGEFDPVPYGGEILVCPEPVTFINRLDEHSNDKKACLAEFRSILSASKRVRLGKAPAIFWFNTTKYGINLRPGLNPQNEPMPVIMGDNAVHGLMAGQTGSGKSVMLNNLIFNLMAEYPPWELDLYLADFKRVEFSRYMNRFETPHIRACAATGEIRYVISMIQYMVDCMNARETLFARLGVQKLADLRNSRELSAFPPVVLPRMLLIVDEFQQMFLDASPREGEQIRDMLTAIVKKGRATGLHILFASQEMSNTLSRSDLANFRIRFALNCNVGVSMDVIGNPEATRIRKGSVIYNTSDGTTETNVLYKVPFVETEIRPEKHYSYFDTFLANMVKFSRSYDFSKSRKFYQEDLQSPFSDRDRQPSPRDSMPTGEYDALITAKEPLPLETILDKIGGYRERVLSESSKYFDILTLGDYVTFSDRKYDIQTLFLEYGRSRNILAVSPRAEDIAYLQKLFAANFMSSPRKKVSGAEYEHEIYSFQPVISGMFPLEKVLGKDRVITNPDELETLRIFMLKKRTLFRLCRECDTPFDFAAGNLRANLALIGRTLTPAQAKEAEEEHIILLHKLFDNATPETLPQICRDIISNPEYEHDAAPLARNLRVFHRYRKNPLKAFPPTVVWLSGIDAVERIPDWLFAEMKNSMDYNVLFILMACSEFDQIRQAEKSCDYIFAGGSNSAIYDRLQMRCTKKEPDSVALDLYIRSTEEYRSFKKYKCSLGTSVSPSVPFDELL